MSLPRIAFMSLYTDLTVPFSPYKFLPRGSKGNQTWFASQKTAQVKRNL